MTLAEREPLPATSGIVFAENKMKKTSMVMGAFPDLICIGTDQHVWSMCKSVYGFEPAMWHDEYAEDIKRYKLPGRVGYIDEAVEVLNFLMENNQIPDVFPGMLLDDATHMCVGRIDAWEQEAVAEAKKANKRPNILAQFGKNSKMLIRMIRHVKHVDGDFWITAHERSDVVDMKDVWHPGGPDFGSKPQVKKIPGWVGFCIRMMRDVDPRSPYPDPWMKGQIFVDNHDKAYGCTDAKFGAFSRTSPPNLRACLEEGPDPYKCRRLPGLEWQDELAEEIAVIIADQGWGAEAQAVINHAFGGNTPRQPSTTEELHLRWACQDGIAKGMIRFQIAHDIIDFGKKAAKPKRGRR